MGRRALAIGACGVLAVAGGGLATARSATPDKAIAHVRCIVESGPPLPRLRLHRKAAIKAGRRMVLRAARSPRTRLGKLVAGRAFTLPRHFWGTYDVSRGESGPSQPIGATFELRFRGPTAVAGVATALDWPPEGEGRRFIRRWGYMIFLHRVAGTVTALDVAVDVRSGRITDIDSGFFSDGFASDEFVPGPCPLAPPVQSSD